MTEKDIMKLTDGTEFLIEPGSELSSIIHIAATEEEAVQICAAITEENLKYVEFSKKGESPYGSYHDLITVTEPTRQSFGKEVTVIISLREKSELEKRVDNLEETTMLLVAESLGGV